MTADGLLMVPDDCSWPVEYNEHGAFRWTRPQFEIVSDNAAHRFVSLQFASLPTENAILVDYGTGVERIPLLHGWQQLDLPLGGDGALKVRVEEPFRAPLDQRDLGLMLSKVVPHADGARHRRMRDRNANALLNEHEFLSGSETIASVPPMLRVTLSKTCNIANEEPCVYCSWDWAKRLEKGSPLFTPEFARRLGRFMELPVAVNDCSYGEPPLERKFGDFVDILTAGDRSFEFTSNGQTLSAKVRRNLLGKPARVYVSIDSATAAGYKRYRDHRFDLVIENLRALCVEKRFHGDLPELHVSFIVMRSNVEEIAAFLGLMKDIGVDRVVLRALYLEDHLDEKRTRHYDVEFDYDAECIPFDELERIGERARALAGAVGMPLTIEWDDFARNVAAPNPQAPICSEPWKTAYLLNRGLTPCCYIREAVVPWSEIDTENLEIGVAEALNAKPFRELRRDLAEGKLGEICERATGCPIVRAKNAARTSVTPTDGD